jgi:p-hydroxybenzoate 3-monooxygenase
MQRHFGVRMGEGILIVRLKTSVCIVGSGPAGLLLSQLLSNSGIDSILIDRRSQSHIEGRIRAGVLEPGTVAALVEAGCADRLQREGLQHDGFELAFGDERHRIDLMGLTGKSVTIYGQTEVTKDLFDKRTSEGAQFYFGVEDVVPAGLKSDESTVSFTHDRQEFVISCDYIAGCDGFHGVTRNAIPSQSLKTYERTYPFGWLGYLVDQPPVSNELIYANHENGFALCSMRSTARSRYYVQCDLTDDIDDWSDDRFWRELNVRIGSASKGNVQIGPPIEKSIAVMRSHVVEPMRYGNLFLAGDAAHIVPATGAKGLNLAVSDVVILARSLTERYRNQNTYFIDNYSKDALTRVWSAELFSWQLTRLMHKFPEHTGFDRKIQRAEFGQLIVSEVASRKLAESYVGLSHGEY